MKWFSYKHNKNKLSFILSLSFLSTTITLIVIILLVSCFVVMVELTSLESKECQEKLDNSINYIKNQQSLLLTTLEDYSYWDEVYNSIDTTDQEWFKRNFTQYLPSHHEIAFCYIVNNNRDVKYFYGNVNVSPLVNGYNTTTHQTNSGFYYDNNKLFMVALAPIRNATGDPKGYMIFGKEINSSMLSLVQKQSGLKIILKINQKIIGNINELTNNEQKLISDQSIKRLSFPNHLSIVCMEELKDIFQQPIGKVYGFSSREKAFRASAKIINYSYFTLFFSVITLVIILRKTISVAISPILTLEKQINQMTKNHKLEQVTVNGSDEIISLCNSFNEMTKSLEEHKERNLHLQNMVIKDELTELYNHRYFYEWSKEKLIKYSQVAVLFIDLDNFKLFNDLHGHKTGDRVLKEFGSLVADFVKDKGLAFRYGGEEIVVLLLNINQEVAFNLAEQLRIILKNNEQIQNISNCLSITISIGIAHYPVDSSNIEELVEKADMAMYYAKYRGKNKTVLYDPAIESEVNEQRVQNELILNSVYALAAAVDAKDHYTGRHSEIVSEYCLLIADKLGILGRDRDLLKIAGLLHDCGKIGIPDEIINKKGFLTEDERQVINNHPIIGANIISHLKTLSVISPWVAYHHERYDGKGYPYGKVGKEIPLHARIIAVADSFHAMVSDRPYRKGLDHSTAISELVKNKGKQFDPDIVDAFVEVITLRDN